MKIKIKVKKNTEVLSGQSPFSEAIIHFFYQNISVINIYSSKHFSIFSVFLKSENHYGYN